MTEIEKKDYLKVVACAFSNNGYGCDIPEHCLIADVCKRVLILIH